MDATKEQNQILKSIDVSLKELVKLKQKELDTRGIDKNSEKEKSEATLKDYIDLWDENDSLKAKIIDMEDSTEYRFGCYIINCMINEQLKELDIIERSKSSNIIISSTIKLVEDFLAEKPKIEFVQSEPCHLNKTVTVCMVFKVKEF